MSTSRRAVVRVLLGLALPVLVLAGCIAPPGGPTTTSTTTTTTTTVPPRDVLCDVWAQRAAVPDLKGAPGTEGLPQPTAPVRPFGYRLDADSVVTAQEVIASGADCKDPGATLTFLQGSILSDRMYRPKNNFPPDGPNAPVPQAHSLNLEAGRAQAPSIEITSFNIQLSSQGIRIYGTLAATINGARSTINFDGRFQDIENFSVELSTAALVIPGFTNQPLEARGRLARTAGVNSIDLNLRAPDLMVGDLAVRDVVVDLSASTSTGIALVLNGQVRTVDSLVALRLDASFDTNGQLRDIDGRLSVDVSSTTASGDPVRVTGEATLVGSSSNLTASFLGTAAIGIDSYGRVGGTIRLDDNGLLVLDGYFDATNGGATTRFQGSLTVDPNGATPNLRAQAEGAFSGLTATGEIVEIDGNVTVTIVGGVAETTVDGSLRVGSIRGQGSASVRVDGATTRLELVGQVSLNGGRADVSGELSFTDGLVDRVALGGSLVGSIPVGKVEVGGSFLLTGDINGLSVAVDGAMTAEGVNVAGRASLELGPAGDVRAARAEVTGSISDGSWGATSFRGTLVADGAGAVLTGVGNFVGAGVISGRVAAVLTIGDVGPRLDASGQAFVTSGSKTVFGDFVIADNELQMARVGLVYPPIVIDPEFLWVRLTTNSAGGCTRVQLLDSTFLAGLFFGIQQAKADLACP